MESKPVKRPQKESNLTSESIPSLKKEIARLKEDILDLKSQIQKANNKTLARETTILTIKNQKAKSDTRLRILQEKYDILKKEINTPYNQAQLHADILAIKGLKHNDPPIK